MHIFKIVSDYEIFNELEIAFCELHVKFVLIPTNEFVGYYYFVGLSPPTPPPQIT